MALIPPIKRLFAFLEYLCYTIFVDITRTVKLKIQLDKDLARRTIQEWNTICNYSSRRAFENGNVSNSTKLHKLTYQDLKAKFKLSSQILISANRQVSAKYLTLRKLKQSPTEPVRFVNSAVCLQGGIRGRDFGFRKDGLSISTVDGRVKGIVYQASPRLQEYFDNWTMGDGRLFIKKGKVYLAVSFSQAVPDVDKPNDAVIGVDRGINNIATMTDGKRTKFFDGKRLKHIRRRYQKTGASLQRKKAQKNTRSIRRVLKRQSGKQARFTKDTMHVVSKRIVEFARETGNPTIAIEGLKGIRDGNKLRKEQRKDVHEWPAYQLKEITTYKAQTYGFEVIEVEPRGTSRGCYVCGHTEKSNRNRHKFLCKACGHQDNSDRNAALNIRLRGILSRQVLAENGVNQLPPKLGDFGFTGKLPVSNRE
jgi:putative transposase